MYILQALQILGLIKHRYQLFEPVLLCQLLLVQNTGIPYESYLMNDMLNNLIPADLRFDLHVDKHLLVPACQFWNTLDR
jgi:hypothetical protein